MSISGVCFSCMLISASPRIILIKFRRVSKAKKPKHGAVTHVTNMNLGSRFNGFAKIKGETASNEARKYTLRYNVFRQLRDHLPLYFLRNSIL